MGHGTPCEASSTRVYGAVQRTPRSRTTASQYHSGSATDRRCRSASEASPWAFMKRAMRERSRCSGVGRQTISLLSVVMGPSL